LTRRSLTSSKGEQREEKERLPKAKNKRMMMTRAHI
jgi:hypothetical protein